jgi:hypothetical protein
MCEEEIKTDIDLVLTDGVSTLSVVNYHMVNEVGVTVLMFPRDRNRR